MNILIVDDEAVSVNGIAAALDWAALEISNVYKAYNMRQAQEIFKKHHVDILLCDIEMPRGSGIDLIEWVQNKGYCPVSIFLTCFSHFDYAASAIRLQVFDYVLKPCEYTRLSEVISRAVIKVKEQQAKQHREILACYWNDDYLSLISNFRNELLNGIIPSEYEALTRLLSHRHLDTELLKHRYHLLFLQVVADKDTEEWNDNLWCFSIQNIITESLNNDLIILPGKSFMIIIPESSYPEFNQLEQACHSMICNLHNILPAEFFAYLARPCTISNAYDICQLLKKEASDRYALESALFVLGKKYSASTLPSISQQRWQNALLAYNSDIILDDIQIFIHSDNPEQFIDSHLLHLIYHQLLKAIYQVLDIHNLPTHQPFLSKAACNEINAFNSITDFCIWAKIVTEKTIALISEKEPTSALIDKLTQYIKSNLNNDLNRHELTQIVHLNPDYMSALFRQKMGISLSEYITRERIKAAKKLLISTDLPINEIAIRTGFQTISYFSKQFKRLENITPFQFRKK